LSSNKQGKKAIYMRLGCCCCFFKKKCCYYCWKKKKVLMCF